MLNKDNSRAQQQLTNAPISIPEVRAAFNGKVIAPGDPEYD
jgi:hypothetical protein